MNKKLFKVRINHFSMGRQRIHTINEIVKRSFGEEFRADLQVRTSLHPASAMRVTSYGVGSEASEIWTVKPFIGPFCRLMIRGIFEESDGSKLVVPRGYVPNAERYAELYKQAGLGDSVEIRTSRKASKTCTITDYSWRREEFIRGTLAQHGVYHNPIGFGKDKSYN